jgi:hypothetical protein
MPKLVGPLTDITAAGTALAVVVGSTTGAPTSGTAVKGQLYADSAGTWWVCTVAGTPGTWQNVAKSYASRIYARHFFR